MNIATVVEGPTDRLVLEAIIEHLIPGEHRFFPLQPTNLGNTFGETGTGWKGVRKWCQESWQLEGSSLDLLLSGDTGEPIDILVIHVDADIATENDLIENAQYNYQELNLPCPPITHTINFLDQTIRMWLNLDELPRQVILAIPSQDMENWTFAALFPNYDLCTRDSYECFQGNQQEQPGFLLTLRNYRRILIRKDGRIKKPLRNYKAILDEISGNWTTVCRICSQANVFTQNIQEISS